MNVKEQRKYIISIMRPYFKEKGFDMEIDYVNNIFIRKVDNMQYNVTIGFRNHREHHFSGIQLSYYEIERIILQVGLANNDLSSYKDEKRWMSTIIDKRNTTNGIIVSDEKSALNFCELGINYLENYGFSFAEHYSYLPNVLAEMDRLEKEGRDWNEDKYGIINGGVAAFFRGLIISKLCNAPNFIEKEKYVDDIFNGESVFNKWLTFYEKLKERLKTLEPMYNIDKKRKWKWIK